MNIDFFSFLIIFLNFFLLNSTTEFRNAFLKTIRQIIRESVRNMSIPSTKQNIGQPTMSMAPRMSTGHVDKYDKPPTGQNGTGSNTLGALSKKHAIKQQILSNTLNSKRKHSHPKSSVEHESSEDRDGDEPPINQFRTRSKTISDTSGA